MKRQFIEITLLVLWLVAGGQANAQIIEVVQAQNWFEEGKEYLSSKQYAKANEAFLRAAKIYQKNKTNQKLAFVFFELAKTNYYLRKFDDAVDYGQKSASLFQNLGNTQNEQLVKSTLTIILRTKWKREGVYAFNQKKYHLAKEAFLKAFNYSKNKPFQKGEIFYFLAASYLSMGMADSALCYNQKACDLFKALMKKNVERDRCQIQMKKCLLLQSKLFVSTGNDNQAANYLTFLFNNYSDLLTSSEKKQNLKNLISLYLSAGRTKDALAVAENISKEDSTLSGIYTALIYKKFGQSEKALVALQKAHEKYLLENNVREDVLCLKQIWPIQFNQGKYEEAEKTLNILLGYKPVLSSADYLNVLKAKLLISQLKGTPKEGIEILHEYENELHRHKQSLTPEENVRFHIGLAESYVNYGMIDSAYAIAQRYDSFVSFFQNIPLKIEYYKTFGQIMARKNNYTSAAKSYKMAYEIALSNNLQKDIVEIVMDLGSIYYGLGAEQEALAWYWKALELLKGTPNSFDLATCYSNIANIYYNRQKSDSAMVYYQKAIESADKNGLTTAVCQNYDRLAHLLESKGNLTEAIDTYKVALKNYKKTASIPTSPQQKLDYFVDIYQIYTKIIELNYKLGNKQAGDRFRDEERTFFTQNKSLLAKITAMKQKGGTLTGMQKKLLAQATGKTVLENKDAASGNINLNLKQVAADINEMQNNFNHRVDEIKFVYGDQLAQYMSISPEQLNALQHYLPDDVLLLSFFPADDKLFIFALKRNFKKIFDIDVSRKKLYKKLKKFKKSINNFQTLLAVRDKHLESSNQFKSRLTEFQKLSHELYLQLFYPIENIIGQEIKHVLIIPSGWLYYVPFQALIYRVDDMPHYLIEKYNFSYQNGNTALLTLTQRPFKHNHYSILAFGNPDGTLPNATDEVMAIHQEFPNSSKIFLGKEATKEALFENSGNFNILHFATHARLNYFNNFKSYIILTPTAQYDEKLTRDDIYKMDLSKMDLVTLSACETAVGKKIPKSEVENIANAFLRRNVSSVVASLWSVSDVSTKELMAEFYKNLKTRSKSEALRNAQLHLLKNTYYSNPYYWAAFELIGDWR